ncbi:amidohydrolase family protein [Mycobacterium sp. pUA109]|uniref:amidohydrolase family protein n=1 Tax=Mycobacterium sp. pUA109 TaxID=3238982 RepID=UPI00351B1C3A
MRIITVEEHFQHPEVSARVAQLAGPPPVPPEALAEFGNAFSLDPDATSRLGGNRLAHMDEVGIDVQVVSHGNGSPGTLPHPEAVQLCRRVNDDLAAQIAEHPDRFRGFATLPLYDPVAAADELRRCVGDLGFVGALIAGSYDGLFLDDARFDPILTAAEAVDLPIYVHPGLPQGTVSQQYYAGSWPASVQVMFSGPAFGWHAEAGIHIVRLILSGALDRHPALKLLSGHWGELAAFYLERFDETLALVPSGLDRTPSDYYRQQVWITPSGMYNHNQLAFMTAELGAERIIYSEDFPYLVRDDVSTFLDQAELSEADTHAIAHANAEALLRI